MKKQKGFLDLVLAIFIFLTVVAVDKGNDILADCDKTTVTECSKDKQ